MKARLQVFARGLRRRLSNLAWGLGGGSVLTLILVGVARGMLPLRRLPDFLAAGVAVAICASLLTTIVAFGAAVFIQHARQVRATADGTGVHVQDGGGTRNYSCDELGGLLRHHRRVWVLLRNGNVMDFAFEDVEEAKAFESTLRGQIGERRIELVPHPTVGTKAFVLLTMMSTCSATSLLGSMVQQHPIFVPLLVLATTIATAARVGGALRGTNFVLGRDGVRLGKKFVPFDRIKTVQVLDERVTIIDVEGKRVSGRVRMPKELSEALNAEFARRMRSEDPSDGTLERRDGEPVHAWLKRIRTSVRDAGFRSPAMQKERVRVAALHPKSPLRVRVAALAGLMEDDPELAKELLEVSADPRLARAAKAAQGSADAWRRVVERLERDGALE